MKTRNFLFAFMLSGFTVLGLAGTSYADTNTANNKPVIGTRVVGSAGLNIRSVPKMGNNIVGQFKQGDQVTVNEKDETEKWCRVDYNNSDNAWVYCKNLMKETANNPTETTPVTSDHSAAPAPSNPNEKKFNSMAPATPANNKPVIGTRIVGSAKLNIRSAAKKANNIVGQFKRGDQVTVNEKDKTGKWCRVDYNNSNNAWVYCRNLMKGTAGNTGGTTTTTPNQPATPSTTKPPIKKFNSMSPAAPENNKPVIGTRIVGSADLDIHSAPNMDSNIMGQFKQADQVTVNEKDGTGEWCRIDYNNNDNAWVYCKNLMKETTENAPETTTSQPATTTTPTHSAATTSATSTSNTGKFRSTANIPKPRTNFQLPTLTMDTTKWKPVNSVKGVTFSYPPELTYKGGSEIKYGSLSYVEYPQPRYVYFRILNSTLEKCKYTDPSKCNNETNVPATPLETYNSIVNKFSQNPRYTAAGDIKIGNTTGKKFILKKKSGNDAVIIVFYGKKGTYIIDNLGGEKAPLDAFLTTFKVEV